ncbi:MAG TPA: formate dehydrogenase accessory protein FdhE [Thermodesulfobacteriota bacterium]|nr:formate dehydrogenase accessory protein FdhE [Thermodesulfobacteriota bacterium]
MATLPDDARQRLDALARESPEWRPWVALLEETLDAVQDPAWNAAVPEPDPARPPGAPLLARARLPVDPRLLAGWLRHLSETASASGAAGAAAVAAAWRGERLDPLAVATAAVCQDGTQLARLAAAAGVDPRPLESVADLAAIPLLQACGRQLAARVPADWRYGYCPICGAWPTLAELRGLERSRRLRCGRCGADWGIEWMRCPFCGADDHRQLGFLVPEKDGDTRKVDTCTACKGYLKAMATLRPWPPYRVMLEDLGSVALDVAALERGFARPAPPGFALEARVVAAGSSNGAAHGGGAA